MRILAVVLVMLGLSTDRAVAEWTRGDTTETMVYYVDRGSIVRDRTHAFMWNLSDYHEQQSWQGHTFQSSSAKFEYDCVAPRTRVIVEYGYSGRKGRGQKKYTVEGPRPWAEAKPGTVAETRLGIACGR